MWGRGDRAACSNLQGLPDLQQHSLTPVLPAGSVRDGRSLSASPSPSVRSGDVGSQRNRWKQGESVALPALSSDGPSGLSECPPHP